MQTKNENGKSWNSASITQFELAKLIYTSGFFNNVNLTATTKLVLMALIQHYNANNADMFPSQKFLAKNLGISEKSVERSIANLKSENLIYYVTKKVNRYRFTAKFFELIKMSVKNRQNVGSDVRQNVGQTNKEEKINKKANFLNFSGVFDKLQENSGKNKNEISNSSQNVDNNGALAPQAELKLLFDKQKKQDAIAFKGYGKNKKYESKKNEIVSPCVHFQDLTGRGTPSTQEENASEQEILAQKVAQQEVFAGRNQKADKSILNNSSSKAFNGAGFKDGSFEAVVVNNADIKASKAFTAEHAQYKKVQQEQNAYKTSVYADKNAGKFVQNKNLKSSNHSQAISFQDFKNQKLSNCTGRKISDASYENDLQTDNSPWFSPLDFEFDDALLWVQALPIPLKKSKFAQKLCEKYNFSQEDIYSDAQKEKLLQNSENDYAELDYRNEKFI